MLAVACSQNTSWITVSEKVNVDNVMCTKCSWLTALQGVNYTHSMSDVWTSSSHFTVVMHNSAHSA